MNRPPPLSIVSVAKVKEKKGRTRFTEQMINPKCENGNKIDVSISVAVDDDKDQQGNVLFDLDENNKETTTAPQPSVAVGGRPHSVQLPWKLHRILQYCREEGLEDIMSWDTTGKTFQIYNKARFEAELMPRFFDTNKFKSFQRSLNLWGFYIRNRGNKSGPTQTTSDSNDGIKTSNVSSQPSQEQGGECYHPYFVRGRPDLCHRMLRIKKKTQKTRSKIKKSNNSSFISDKSLEQREAFRKTLLGINVSTGLSSTTPVHSSVGRSCNNKVQSEQVLLPPFPGRALGLQTFSGGINSLSMSSSSFHACSSVESSMGINKILVKMLTPRSNNDNSLVNSRSTWNGNLLPCPRLCNGSMLQHYDESNVEANARTLLDLASSSFSPGRPSIASTGAPISCDAFVTALTGTRGLGNSGNSSNLSDRSRSAVDLSPFLMEASHMSPRHRLLLLDFAAQRVGR